MSTHSAVLERLKHVVGSSASSEELFDIVLKMHGSPSVAGSAEQTEMCENVLQQLVRLVEIETRRKIAIKLAALEQAPKRIVRLFSVEPIYVAEPVLLGSPVLSDKDLLTVMRVCGASHFEAIANRETVSVEVTNELVRVGNVQIWEQIAGNKGAQLGDKAVQFLVNRSKENEKIQMGLMDRPELAEATVRQIIKEAGESVRERLVERGRQDLVHLLENVKAKASERILSTSSTLGYEFETAMVQLNRLKLNRAVTVKDIETAIHKVDFPMVTAVFAEISGLNLEEAVHWLSRREVDSAVIAMRALGFDRALVQTLLEFGPWKIVLQPETKARALRTFDQMKPDIAKRVFSSRRDGFAQKTGTA